MSVAVVVLHLRDAVDPLLPGPRPRISADFLLYFIHIPPQDASLHTDYIAPASPRGVAFRRTRTNAEYAM